MAEGTQLPPQLIKFWTTGAGAARIRWNTPQDYARCITEIQAAVTKDGKPPLGDATIHGLCSTLHRIATGGFSPGHAPGDKA